MSYFSSSLKCIGRIEIFRPEYLTRKAQNCQTRVEEPNGAKRSEQPIIRRCAARRRRRCCCRSDGELICTAEQLSQVIRSFLRRQYLEIYDHRVRSEPSELYSGAARDFQSSRQIFETVIGFGGGGGGGGGAGNRIHQKEEEEFASLIGVCKKNFVVASILAKDSSRKVDFDFGSNSTFPTVTFV